MRPEEFEQKKNNIISWENFDVAKNVEYHWPSKCCCHNPTGMQNRSTEHLEAQSYLKSGAGQE